MIQLACWLLFGAILVVLSLGCGLLLERAAGLELPGPLVVPAGLAVMICAGELTTKLSGTAPLTTPFVVVLAVVGFVLGRPRRLRSRFGPWPLVAAVAVYVAYLLPVLATGDPTFTGYVKLDDTATWMAMTDGVLAHGHSLAHLAPSTYQATLGAYLGGGEPVGALLPWGIGHQLAGQDLAWTFQPYLALLGAMLALSLWPLADRLVPSPRLRALVVFAAAQSALIYGYSLWGGIKELAAAVMLPLVVASAIPVLEQRARVRSFVPLAIACLAMLSVLAYGGAVWLPLVLAAVAVFAFWTWSRSAGRLWLAGLLALAAVLAALLVRGGLTFAQANGALTGGELGNLLHPLNGFQLFGIWPAADFRIDPPDATTLAYVLIALAIAAGTVALVVAWRRRSWTLWLYLASGLVGIALVSARGSPWVQAKAIAIASPAALLASLVGAAVLLEGRPWARAREVRADAEAPRSKGAMLASRALGAAALAAVCGGVLWSNATAYHHVTLAPYAQFRELQHIGDEFAGRGPTLLNEYQPYGARHFLRRMDAESPSELRRRTIPLRSGQLLPKAGYADLDQFQLPALLVYRTIVIRTSPVASRPPQPYRLVDAGTWYQVWQRPLRPSRPVLASIPLGNAVDPTGVASCAVVTSLARSTPTGGLVVAASAERPQVMSVPSPLPVGETAASFVARAAGRYQVWLGGSFFRLLRVDLDSIRTASSHQQLNEAGEWTPLGSAALGPGRHAVTLSYGDATLYPGSGGPGGAGPFFPVGPLAVVRASTPRPLTYVAPSAARSLCGARWDWIESLGPPVRG
jgi:hypothetical protein